MHPTRRPNLRKKVLSIALLAAAGLAAVVQAVDPDHPYHEFYFFKQSSNAVPMINRPNEPDYQASAIRNADGTLDVWYCSSTVLANGWRGDTIFKASFNAQNQLTGGPTKVLEHTGLFGTPDGAADCDVAVVKHGAPGVTWPGGSMPATASELYYLYYECAPQVTDRAIPASRNNLGPNQICLAASVDGTTWMDYSAALPCGHPFCGIVPTTPTPVVARDPAVDILCDFSATEIPGEYVVNHDCISSIPVEPPVIDPDPDFDPYALLNSYASGHPTALSLPTGPGGAREVWLYYYDSKGDWGLRGTYLRKSADGIDFGTAESALRMRSMDATTGLPIPGAFPVLGKVRYFDVRVGDHDGVFIATHNFDSKNLLTYSFDGENWFHTHYPPREEMRVGEAVPGTLCVAPGAAVIVADKYGSVNRLSGVEILSGEGKLGPFDLCTATNGCSCYSALEDHEMGGMRGATWALYMLTGDFGHIAKVGADVCALYDEQNVRDQHERGIVGGTAGSLLWIDEDARYGYTDWNDFQAKNFNLGSAAFFNVNNATFDDLEECPWGGLRAVFAVPDAMTVARGLAARIPVLANDSGGPLDPASIVIASPPGHGTVSVDGAGVVTYTHNGDAATSDAFGYSVRATNGLRSNVAGVQVTIAPAQVLYRVNAGGPALSGGWTEDRSWSSGGVPSSRVNAAATLDTTYPYASTVTVDASVPVGVPPALFQNDRYALPTGVPMRWEFPVDAGRQVEVRLYFAENYRTTPGRVFDVTAEGAPVVTDLDTLVAAGAAHRGIMRSFKTFVNDGQLNLEFLPNAGADSPLVDGIEILGLSPLGNPVPVANGDFSKVAVGWKTLVNVLTNDTDSAPGTLNPATVTIVNGPQYGTATVNPATGVITYTNTNGAQTADRFSYTVRDNLGALSNTAAVAITIKPVSVLYRVNAGGPAVTATPGWVVDTAATPSPYVNSSVPQGGNNNVYYYPGTISNVPVGLSQTLYRYQRYDNGLAPNMIWNIPIAVGAGPEVEVQLHFAETYYTAAGQRVFGVKMENGVPYPSLDIFQLAGGANRAYSPPPVRLSTDDGALTIELLMGAASAPTIAAIEVRGPANN